MDRRHHLRRRQHASAGGDEALGFVAAQAAELQPREARRAHELRQRFGQRMLARQLAVAIGAEHAQPLLGEFADKEGQQSQRPGIRPVQVVEYQQQRLERRQPLPQLRHGHEEPEACLVAVGERRQCGALGQVRRQFRHDLDHRRRVGAERGGKVRARQALQRSADRARPRQERRRAGLFEAAPPRDPHAALLCEHRRLLRKPRLAAAGIAGDREPTAAAVERLCNGGAQQLEFRLAPDQHGVARWCAAILGVAFAASGRH